MDSANIPCGVQKLCIPISRFYVIHLRMEIWKAYCGEVTTNRSYLDACLLLIAIRDAVDRHKDLMEKQKKAGVSHWCLKYAVVPGQLRAQTLLETPGFGRRSHFKCASGTIVDVIRIMETAWMMSFQPQRRLLGGCFWFGAPRCRRRQGARTGLFQGLLALGRQPIAEGTPPPLRNLLFQTPFHEPSFAHATQNGDSFQLYTPLFILDASQAVEEACSQGRGR